MPANMASFHLPNSHNQILGLEPTSPTQMGTSHTLGETPPPNTHTHTHTHTQQIYSNILQWAVGLRLKGLLIRDIHIIFPLNCNCVNFLTWFYLTPKLMQMWHLRILIFQFLDNIKFSNIILNTAKKNLMHIFIFISSFLNGAKLALNSVNSVNLINHWSMNRVQFKDYVSHMCLAGTVVAPGSLVSNTRGGKYFLSFNSLN